MTQDAPPPSAPGREPTARFSDRVADYVRARPVYPAPAIEAALAGGPARPRVADVGAGTGISSRALAGAGAEVLAIEPNEPMGAAGAAERTAGVTWSDATGEATGLADASVDAVVCAQAFHWLDADRALHEFRRILDPASTLRRVALLWNTADASDEATADYLGTLARHATEPPTSPSFVETPRALERHPGFESYRLLTFANEQRLDAGGLLARALSASYMPREGPAGKAASAAIGELHARRAVGGVFRMALTTHVHLAERAP